MLEAPGYGRWGDFETLYSIVDVAEFNEALDAFAEAKAKLNEIQARK